MDTGLIASKAVISIGMPVRSLAAIQIHHENRFYMLNACSETLSVLVRWTRLGNYPEESRQLQLLRTIAEFNLASAKA